MKRYTFWLATVLVVAVTILSGVIQGRMRNRWGPPQDTVAAAEKLAQIPRQFGNWRLQSTEKLDKSTENMLECWGYIVRNYVHQTTGDVVSVTVLIGPTGPIAVHTPEVCFASRNYQSREQRKRVTIRGSTGGEDEFWALNFNIDNLRGDVLRTYYAWSTGGRWTAANDPRFQYVGQPYLYKMQLSSRLSAGIDLESDDPCRKFLQDFLPAVGQCLVDPSAK
jgi:hypothetical protein